LRKSFDRGLKVRLKLTSLASSSPSKVALDAASALPSNVLSEAEEAPAGMFFERFRNLDFDAL
jgi:hypothetical protein